MPDADRTIAAINATLEAWETGADAYRWEDGAEPGVERGVRLSRPRLHWVPDFRGIAPTAAELSAANVITGITLEDM